MHLVREEPGDVPRRVESLPRGDPGGVLRQGQADHPAAGELRPRLAVRGHHVRFPGAGRGDQAGEEPGAGEHPGYGLALLRVQVRPGERRGRPALGDQLRDGALGGLLEDPLLGVNVRGGDEPGLAGLPVHRCPVLAVIERGDVDQVRHRGDPDHVGVRDPPGQRVIGHRIQVRAPVRGRGEHGHLPVELPLQVAPRECRVLPLGLGDRRADDPVPLRLARHLPGHRFGVLQGVRLGRFVKRGELLHAGVPGLADPRGERFLGRPGAVLRSLRSALLRLRLAGLERDPLAQLVQRGPVRRPAVDLPVLQHELGELLLDLRRPRGVGGDRLGVNAADLEAVAVFPLDQRQAEPGQRLRLGRAGVRGVPEPRPARHQLTAVERPPLLVAAVRLVGALCLVQDRGLHVQLRVIGPAGVLEELHGHEPLGIAEFAAARTVMAGSYDRSALLRQLEHPVRAGHHRRFDSLGVRSEPLGRLLVARFACLLRRGEQAGVHQRDRLLGAERHVVVGRAGPHLRPLLEADVPPFLGRGEPAQRGDPLGDRLLDLRVSGPGLVLRRLLPGSERDPVRADAVVEQGPHHVGAGLVPADPAVQAQDCGAFAGPDAGRLPRGGQVVVGADLIEVVVDVKARRGCHLSHTVTSSPDRPGPGFPRRAALAANVIVV